MNIYEKIQKAKELILQANLKKTGKNNFAGYTYYELADLLPTIIQVCNKLKLFTKVSFNDEFAMLDIINVEEPNETLQYTSPMKELNLKGANAIQALGGVQTYQRRYLYMSAFDIIENDMFDGMQAIESKDVTKAKKATLKKMNDVIAKFSETSGRGIDETKKYLMLKIGASESTLTEQQAKKIIDMVSQSIK